MKFPVRATSAAALAAFLSGIGPVEGGTRKPHNQPSAHHAPRDVQQDLPVPHPSSRRALGQNHSHRSHTHAGRPQDISGGNGQKLTRQRKF